MKKEQEVGSLGRDADKGTAITPISSRNSMKKEQKVHIFRSILKRIQH